MEGILQKPNRVRTFECTKNAVISKFASDDQVSEEIKMNVLKVSLLDPVAGCFIRSLELAIFSFRVLA